MLLREQHPWKTSLQVLPVPPSHTPCSQSNLTEDPSSCFHHALEQTDRRVFQLRKPLKSIQVYSHVT